MVLYIDELSLITHPFQQCCSHRSTPVLCKDDLCIRSELHASSLISRVIVLLLDVHAVIVRTIDKFHDVCILLDGSTISKFREHRTLARTTCLHLSTKL